MLRLGILRPQRQGRQVVPLVVVVVRMGLGFRKRMYVQVVRRINSPIRSAFVIIKDYSLNPYR